jgi:hypothetical protein
MTGQRDGGDRLTGELRREQLANDRNIGSGKRRERLCVEQPNSCDSASDVRVPISAIQLEVRDRLDTTGAIRLLHRLPRPKLCMVMTSARIDSFCSLVARGGPRLSAW